MQSTVDFPLNVLRKTGFYQLTIFSTTIEITRRSRRAGTQELENLWHSNRSFREETLATFQLTSRASV